MLLFFPFNRSVDVSSLVVTQGRHDHDAQSAAQANRLWLDVAERRRDGVGRPAGSRRTRTRLDCTT